MPLLIRNGQSVVIVKNQIKILSHWPLVCLDVRAESFIKIDASIYNALIWFACCSVDVDEFTDEFISSSKFKAATNFCEIEFWVLQLFTFNYKTAAESDTNCGLIDCITFGNVGKRFCCCCCTFSTLLRCLFINFQYWPLSFPPFPPCSTFCLLFLLSRIKYTYIHTMHIHTYVHVFHERWEFVQCLFLSLSSHLVPLGDNARCCCCYFCGCCWIPGDNCDATVCARENRRATNICVKFFRANFCCHWSSSLIVRLAPFSSWTTNTQFPRSLKNYRWKEK